MTVNRFSKLTVAAGPRVRAALSLVALVTAQAASAMPASATEAPGGMAVAESQFGNGTISGPIRKGSRGKLEVRLPSGTWIQCRSSCSETLRVETIDFWQAQAKMTNECGLLGCVRLTYPSR